MEPDNKPFSFLKYIFPLLFGIQSFSGCTEYAAYEFILETEDQQTLGEEDLNSLVSNLNKRFDKTAYRLDRIEVIDEQSTQLLAEASMPVDANLSDLRTLFGSHSVGLWETYRMTDPEILNIPDSLLVADGFSLHKGNNQGMHPPEVIGHCTNEAQMESIQAALAPVLARVPGLKLFWAKNPNSMFQDQGKTVYELYMIKAKNSEKAPVDESHIKSAKSTTDQYTGQLVVDFEMNEEGAQIWSELTKQATQDNNRSIAIIVNDRVYSCPRVMSSIPNGKCSISGNFSDQEAQTLAQQLSMGKLPIPLRIISEQSIDNH